MADLVALDTKSFVKWSIETYCKDDIDKSFLLNYCDTSQNLKCLREVQLYWTGAKSVKDFRGDENEDADIHFKNEDKTTIRIFAANRKDRRAVHILCSLLSLYSKRSRTTVDVYYCVNCGHICCEGPYNYCESGSYCTKCGADNCKRSRGNTEFRHVKISRMPMELSKGNLKQRKLAQKLRK